jgi:hypothetical protein
MLGGQFEHEPSDVSPHESFGNVIRIFIVVNVLVVGAMIGTPVEAGVFERAGSENERKQLHRPLGLEGKVRKQSVISESDTHSGSWH